LGGCGRFDHSPVAHVVSGCLRRSSDVTRASRRQLDALPGLTHDSIAVGHSWRRECAICAFITPLGRVRYIASRGVCAHPGVRQPFGAFEKAQQQLQSPKVRRIKRRTRLQTYVSSNISRNEEAMTHRNRQPRGGFTRLERSQLI